MVGYVVETGSVGEWFLVLSLDDSDTRITDRGGREPWDRRGMRLKRIGQMR